MNENILLVAVGDGGIQTVKRIQKRRGVPCSLLLANTESRSLRSENSLPNLLLGENSLRGLGTAGDTELGWDAAEESNTEFSKHLEGKQTVIFFSCLGGGTGSGAIPSLVRQAQKAGCLTIVFVCTPFQFLGKKQKQNATDCIEQLKSHAHGVIILPNDALLAGGADLSIEDSFLVADGWLYQSLVIMTGMLQEGGLLQIDLAVLQRVFSGGQPIISLFSVGSAQGDDASTYALESLFSSPLLQKNKKESIEGLLIYVMGGPSLTIGKVNTMVSQIHERLINPDETILGASTDDEFGDRICVAVFGLGRLDASPTRTLKNIATESVQKQESTTVQRNLPVHQSKLTKKSEPEVVMVQEELFLEDDLSQNTIFDKNNPSLIKGINYDIPTFLRQGIKVNIK